MPRSVRGGFVGIREKSVSWVLAYEEDGWLSELAEALRRVLHVVWGRWKSQHRKIVYLLPHVKKPFNSKVIKSFVPEVRSRKCFRISGFLCYLYMDIMNVLRTGMNMSISHIHVWLCDISPRVKELNSEVNKTVRTWTTESACFRLHCFVCFAYVYRDIGPAVRVFANGPGDLGSIPGRVIPKTLKMVLDTTLLNTQHYKVRFKGKVEQSWEWSSALPYTLV